MSIVDTNTAIFIAQSTLDVLLIPITRDYRDSHVGIEEELHVCGN